MENPNESREKLKNTLIIKKEEILRRIKAIDQDKRRLSGPLERDLEEQAIAIENDEVIDALDEQSREELRKIEMSLEQIERGTYGNCRSCGSPISPARLAAIPHAQTCIHCASGN